MNNEKQYNTLSLPCFTENQPQPVPSPEQQRQRILSYLTAANTYGLDFASGWLDKVLAAYEQPHRYFHTLTHLLSIIESCARTVEGDAELLSRLYLTALFHDAVWYPQGGDSEELSAEAFDFVCDRYQLPLPAAVRDDVRGAILATKTQSCTHELAKRFHEYDCQVIIHGNPVDLLGYEFQIFREFQYLNMTEYRRGRSAFFARFSRRFPECSGTMRFLIEYLERRRPRVGIYAGTFNPFHIGHLSILEKAELMFDKVIVAVGINPHKNVQRDARIEQVLPFHEVVSFDTLMVDLIQQESVYSDVTLVRGLRNGYDLDYEMNQLCYMQEMLPSIHAVYIPCDKRLEHISSSSLTALARFNVNGRDSIYYPHKFGYYGQPVSALFG